jgi:HlyD family secretion protein
VDVGQTVAASLQAPTLFKIAADLTAMQLKASIDEADVGQIQPNQAVTFTVEAYPQEPFSGRVEEVRLNPTVESNVVTYAAMISAPNPDLKLKPGMTATLHIEVARRDDALRVPLRALRFRPESDGSAPPPADGAKPAASAVFVSDGRGGLRRVELRTGLRDDRYAELVGGELAAGDAVVVAYKRDTEAEARRPTSPFGPPRLR